MTDLTLNQVSKSKCFGGFQYVYSHNSSELKCRMNFAIFIPPQCLENEQKLSLIYWLSGLTCTEVNFIQKAGAQKYAAEHGIIIACPDTSPRGCNIEGESDSWDFGLGAGFYVDSLESKWKDNYRMYSYVTKEFPNLLEQNFPVDLSRQSIMGHSMGGHGALLCFLKNPGFYKSVSAFAPICNPVNCSWGQKIFKGYLGEDKETWKQYDSCELTKSYSGPTPIILIDQGKEDQFLSENQLNPDEFVKQCTEAKIPVMLRMQEGYDHSYFFVATFIEQHIAHHSKYLNA